MADSDESKRKLFIFSLDTDSGQVVKFESADTGGRHELSEEEKAKLAKEGGDGALEELLEEAFEAGIACVMGDDSAENGGAIKSQEDADLRRLLLDPLIEHSGAARLMRREVLSRAILRSLIQQSLNSKPGSGAGGALQTGRSGSRRTT